MATTTTTTAATASKHKHPINYKFTGTDKVSFDIIKSLEYKSELEKDLGAIKSSLNKIKKAYNNLCNDKNTKGDWKNWLSTNVKYAKKYDSKIDAREKEILNAILIGVASISSTHDSAGAAINNALGALGNAVDSM